MKRRWIIAGALVGLAVVAIIAHLRCRECQERFRVWQKGLVAKRGAERNGDHGRHPDKAGAGIVEWQ